jgi:hypothetical protein
MPKEWVNDLKQFLGADTGHSHYAQLHIDSTKQEMVLLVRKTVVHDHFVKRREVTEVKR